MEDVSWDKKNKSMRYEGDGSRVEIPGFNRESGILLSLMELPRAERRRTIEITPRARDREPFHGVTMRNRFQSDDLKEILKIEP